MIRGAASLGPGPFVAFRVAPLVKVSHASDRGICVPDHAAASLACLSVRRFKQSRQSSEPVIHFHPVGGFGSSCVPLRCLVLQLAHDHLGRLTCGIGFTSPRAAASGAPCAPTRRTRPPPRRPSSRLPAPAARWSPVPHTGLRGTTEGECLIRFGRDAISRKYYDQHIGNGVIPNMNATYHILVSPEGCSTRAKSRRQLTHAQAG